MKSDASHIKQIKVVSNTHWDREWRKSFEKTRRLLVEMMDTTLEVLEKNNDFHSMNTDGQSILIDDYLEIRPEKREQVEKYIREGRLIIGPYYTLAEQFSISHEPIVRNLIWGRQTMERYGAKPGTVAYTPSSWGQTGQLPQILADFGLQKMMFYRGISHDESDAIFIWSAPDGTKVYASRFALFARYNWYYFVHRVLTRDEHIAVKVYNWGKFDEVPFKVADNLAGDIPVFYMRTMSINYDKSKIKDAIEEMISLEGPHYNTGVFLAMNGHDLSSPYMEETRIIEEAREILADKYSVEHTSLENYWSALLEDLKSEDLTVLTGERRAYLKTGNYTTLLGDTISSRTYLKQKDHIATVRLVNYAEPLATLAYASGDKYPVSYMKNGWQYLLSNHTHDSNGGCVPDEVCLDMEYRYRKTTDIGDIVSEDSMAYIADNLSFEGVAKDVVQLIVYNTLPFERDVVSRVNINIPSEFNANFISLKSDNDKVTEYQLISSTPVKKRFESKWELGVVMSSIEVDLYARFKQVPALGYRVYTVIPDKNIPRKSGTLITGTNVMENEYIKVSINSNGTADILNKKTGKLYENLNYVSDEGECGDPWLHIQPVHDMKYNSMGVNASISVTESGPLSCTIVAEYNLPVPSGVVGNQTRSSNLVELPIKVEYTLEKNSRNLKIKFTVDNKAKDHYLRVNFPTGLATDETWTDSHYDVLSHSVFVPDSTGWIEEARGTHPLRTFVEMSDKKDGFGLITKGLFEYEAFENAERTLALTLIRSYKMSLMSEGENFESNIRSQCLGINQFEYALNFHEGDWKSAGMLNSAAEFNTPVRTAISGRGKGTLGHEASLFAMNNRNLLVTCVKQAEDGNGMIIRLFNPLTEEQRVVFSFGYGIKTAKLCRMDENEIKVLDVKDNQFSYNIEPKKIRTFRVILSN